MKIENINHSFGGRQVLKGVTLSIEKGEIMGLLGPSGAGKTTLINIITGQLKPDGGKVFIDGKSMGIMMDNWGLYERFSVYDNLKFYARLFSVPYKKIDEALEKTNLAQAKKTTVSNLSKGMKNRVNLCRALLKEPDILILDEPASGLDPATAKEIHSLILQQREKGTTVFLTTHNMTEADKLCDNVALLNLGSIVEYGNPKDICRRYNHQNKIVVRKKDGKTMEFPNKKTSGEQLKTLMEQEEISAIHSTEPDLETVFLELTGRRFS